METPKKSGLLQKGYERSAGLKAPRKRSTRWTASLKLSKRITGGDSQAFEELGASIEKRFIPML
jgi:hypothetical protein